MRNSCIGIYVISNSSLFILIIYHDLRKCFRSDPLDYGNVRIEGKVLIQDRVLNKSIRMTRTHNQKNKTKIFRTKNEVNNPP